MPSQRVAAYLLAEPEKSLDSHRSIDPAA